MDLRDAYTICATRGGSLLLVIASYKTFNAVGDMATVMRTSRRFLNVIQSFARRMVGSVLMGEPIQWVEVEQMGIMGVRMWQRAMGIAWDGICFMVDSDR